MFFFLSFLSGVALFYSFQYFPFFSCGIFLIFSVYLMVKKRFIFILLILSGIAFSFLRYEPLEGMSHVSGKEVIIKGIFESHPVKNESDMFKQVFTVISDPDKKTGEEMNGLAGREIVLF